MNKKPFIIFTVLLLLCFVPTIAQAEYSEGSIHPSSVRSFDITSNTNNLTYPDAFADSTLRFTYTGYTGYQNSWVKDGVYYEDGGDGAEFLFRPRDTSTHYWVESFNYYIYAGYIGDGDHILVWDDDQQNLLTYINSAGWYNGTFEFINLQEDLVQCLLIAGKVDYFAVELTYMTSYSNEWYGESFLNVSDWSYTGTSMISDGDVVTHTYSGTWNRIQSDSISLTSMAGYYVEYRLRCSLNLGTGNARLFGYKEDGAGGGYAFYDSVAWSTEWQTFRTYLEDAQVYSDGPLESIRFSGNIAATNTVEVDYVSFYRGDDCGFNQDGSVTDGVNSTGYGDTATSNGNQLTLTSNVDGSVFEIFTDTTSTTSGIDTDYFPFLSVNCYSVSSGDGWTLDIYDGSDWYEVESGPYGWQTSTGIYLYNVEYYADEIYKFRINTTATATIKFDWVQLYGIANYTYSGTGTSEDDYCYVSDSILYTSNSSFTSIVLDQDPLFNINTAVYSLWETNTSIGTPQVDFYIDGAWDGYDASTSGTFTEGTLTDFRIKFTGYADFIEFLILDGREWNVIDNIDIYFNILGWKVIQSVIITFISFWLTYALDFFLIFLGLIMMPSSMMYLVYEQKRELSMNRAFLALLAFMIGCALFVGGIM